MILDFTVPKYHDMLSFLLGTLSLMVCLKVKVSAEMCVVQQGTTGCNFYVIESGVFSVIHQSTPIHCFPNHAFFHRCRPMTLSYIDWVPEAHSVTAANALD